MYGSGPGRVESGGVADTVLIFLFRLGPVPRGPASAPITGAGMSVPGWLAAENPDPVAPRDPRASRGMAVICSGDRRCTGGPAREKVAGTCFHCPNSTAVRRGRAQWAFLTGCDGPWVRRRCGGGDGRARDGAGGAPGTVRGGRLSKSVAKALCDRIGREKNCGISTILFRRSGPIGAFATDLDNRPSGRLNEHPELRPRCGAWDSWDVRGAPARRGSGGRHPRPPTTAPGPRQGASRPRCRDDPPDPRAGLGAAVRLKRDRPRPRRPRRPQRSVSARSPMRPRRPLR